MTPVKEQEQCKNSAAFATASALEACFFRWTNKAIVLSEQQLLDCAYNYEGASGCEGSPLFSYLNWVSTDGKQKLAAGKDYPYTGLSDKLFCPKKPVQSGAVVKDVFTTLAGDEKQLKELVYTYFAVVTKVCFSESSWEKPTPQGSSRAVPETKVELELKMRPKTKMVDPMVDPMAVTMAQLNPNAKL